MATKKNISLHLVILIITFLITAVVVFLIVLSSPPTSSAGRLESFNASRVVPKTIVTCFAGRRVFFSILYKYLAWLVLAGMVHEVHLWNFTRDPLDEEWFRSGAYNVDMLPQFKIMEVKDKKQWAEYYKHYADNKGSLYQDDDVIIKLDDDIVYIDVGAFPEFIMRRRRERDCLFAFPSIINNGVCAYYQDLYGFTSGFFEPNELPYDTFYGRVVTDGKLAMRLHTMFCKHDRELTARARSLPQPIVVHKLADRISINFFAVLGKDLHVFHDITDDDEHQATVEVTKNHRRQHYIDMSMFVCHAMFGSQTGAMSQDDVVSMYRELLPRLSE
jgi:hypothetical protein